MHIAEIKLKLFSLLFCVVEYNRYVVVWLFLSSAMELLAEQKSERQLADRLNKKDVRAIEELYDKYGKRVYSIALGITRDSGIAEDVVQETFIRIWNRAPLFDPERGSPGIWLISVARNRALDHLRSLQRGSSRTHTLETWEHPSIFVDMVAELSSVEDEKRVRSAIARLSDKQREVIELAYYEGLSQSEMAERLHQPLGTVKTRVRQSLQLLRSDLAKKAASE